MGAVTRWFCLTKARASASTRRFVLLVATLIAGMLAFAAPASAVTETFNFTGAAQTWTVPAGVSEATFDLYGAQGDGAPVPVFAAGLGGQATATIPVTPGDSIQVNVGGGGNGTGGFNGGGDPAVNAVGQPGSGGGGASDIRIGGTALANRALVAGGGGGEGNSSCGNVSAAGGAGGGPFGLPGGSSGCQGGVGGGGGTPTGGGSAASPATGGAFGVGGTGGASADQGLNSAGGGGGGGWYGGGGGTGAGGGGGSSYGPPGTVFHNGVRAGDGLVTVTYTTIDTLIDSVQDLNLPSGTTSTLLAKLNAAQHSLDAGKAATACRQLAAFITQVKIQSGKNIPGPAAADLIAGAKQVRGSLKCGAGLSCAGKAATIVGTGRFDKLKGTTGDDVIVAAGGDDTVVGLEGDDLICASGGADVIQGGRGDDTLRGGHGEDELRGGGGSDKCRGGRGRDSKHHC